MLTALRTGKAVEGSERRLFTAVGVRVCDCIGRQHGDEKADDGSHAAVLVPEPKRIALAASGRHHRCMRLPHSTRGERSFCERRQ
jgi:hypothetical protein